MSALSEHWEGHYSGTGRHWTGRPNPLLVSTVSDLPPGRALDLGCGEGGDAVWLARQGWDVTAVDVSANALERTRALASSAGVLVRTSRHDLSSSFPAGEFELVSAQYFHSPVEFPREAALRRAASAVVPGGLLLIVDHGAAPPWSPYAHDGTYFPTPAETLAALALDPAAWSVERVEALERETTGPGGMTGTLVDNIIAVMRNPE
ncbi:methyltransferase [Virgisporangium aliadipatigenens]|uniref:Methyltransferase n=1 Tax=Virgisporangium aliadipatigenens TaxID=741659 RepID=A0A8J3YXM1_9ACTN|nr:class I SAM-dependent methyltransferase [Virgisporangium aliadipatigenens]GIJ51576.1 methyltransferase [Virgisporangium aliadipatigenens]